jgi:hypothetical protein
LEFGSCRVRGELLYELGDYEDALADLQADRAVRGHENTLKYEQNLTRGFLIMSEIHGLVTSTLA